MQLKVAANGVDELTKGKLVPASSPVEQFRSHAHFLAAPFTQVSYLYRHLPAQKLGGKHLSPTLSQKRSLPTCN
jgi:hypothetical protein